MDESVLDGCDRPRIYDCVGVGFGPSNIALAIALEERGLLENSLFLETHAEVFWHPGMLIEGTDIQHNPLRDFITPRNPCSPYGFLSYLKSKERLLDYLNLPMVFPPRTEYAGYVVWVARRFANYVQFSTQVSDVSYASDECGSDLIRMGSTDGRCFYARSAVIGCGRSQYVPVEFKNLLCEDIIHSDDYIWVKKKWLESWKNPRIAVVGGSQSAIEILLNLSESCDVVGITRSFGFKQKDLSPFTERIYHPEFINYFYNLPVVFQNEITKDLWRSNYGAADHDVINALTLRLYEQKVTCRQNIQLHQNSMIKKIEANPETNEYKISLVDCYNQNAAIVEVNGIIFATGYKNFGNLENQEPYHPILEGIASNLVFREDGGPDILRDYRLNNKCSAPNVYLNGLCEASHGFGDAGSFSILSIRGDVIASSLQEHIKSKQIQSKIVGLGGAVMNDLNNFKIEDLVQRHKGSEMTFEYNCDMRRIYPWRDKVNTKRPITEFGMIWVEVKPGTEVAAHDHDEEESFLIVSGKAELEIEGQSTVLKRGDVVYIPRFWTHQMKNPFEETLVFADIYWDWKGRTKEQYLEADDG